MICMSVAQGTEIINRSIGAINASYQRTMFTVCLVMYCSNQTEGGSFLALYTQVHPGHVQLNTGQGTVSSHVAMSHLIGHHNGFKYSVEKYTIGACVGVAIILFW